LIVMVTLAHLNACPADEFATVLGPIFEQSPWIATAAVTHRPFASREQLHAVLCGLVRNASEERQLQLIRAHPDLAARQALTSESSREQAAAGLVGLTAAEMAEFERYNTAYKARFGFPFVICARRHDKQAILRAFGERLSRTREEEIVTALGEIVQIAELRLADVLP
jgi:2-oxo-4-hydroxy-4-carboxy-5-ureidoimidazoline decarboxylase